MLRLSTDALHHWLSSNAGFELIDVRSRQLFHLDHLPGADNVPLVDPSFEEKVRKLVEMRRDDLVGEKLVVYGANGEEPDAHDAAARLEAAGFRAVYEFTEGLNGWRHAGLVSRQGSA